MLEVTRYRTLESVSTFLTSYLRKAMEVNFFEFLNSHNLLTIALQYIYIFYIKAIFLYPSMIYDILLNSTQTHIA
jgi:hypothetical protein